MSRDGNFRSRPSCIQSGEVMRTARKAGHNGQVSSGAKRSGAMGGRTGDDIIHQQVTLSDPDDPFGS
jgi:hypothetical protein